MSCSNDHVTGLCCEDTFFDLAQLESTVTDLHLALQLVCAESAAQSSGCSLSDQACFCRDPVLDTSFDACVSASCTVKEVLST